ncbi:MAG: hypothetical protein RL522_1531 [Pseudomonadota bacterium]|jgi:uncharacterized protein
MNRVLRVLLALLLVAAASLASLASLSIAHAQQGLQPVPPLSARVVDTVGLLDAGARQRIEAVLASLEQDKGAQVAFLTVATTAPEDIASYANRVGNTWKIGRRGVGDGVLLVVARDDRAVRIEVAKTLEGAIPDLAAKMIIDDAITPAFRRGDFSGGLEAAAERISALVRGEALPAPTRRAGGGNWGELSDLAVFLFLAVPVVAGVLRAMFGKRIGSLVTGVGVGGIALVVTGSVLIALAAAILGAVLSLLGLAPLGRHIGRHSPGWGMGTGGWGGGGSWGGGGFRSGGGGDFGGGGASGRW